MKTLVCSLWRRRALLWYLVWVDLKLSYRNKVLGYLWSLLDPLMLMVVYVILVQVIFRRGEPQYPVLLFSALLAWRCFLHSTQEAATCITSKAKLLQTVAVPKIIFPTQVVVSNTLQYIFGLGALVPMLILMKAKITPYALWLIPVFGVQLVFTYGVCLIVAVVGVYFRDLQNILRFGLRMWWYLSPGLFSVADRIPERLQRLYMIINPFAPLLETYKNILVRGKPPSEYLAVAAAIAVAIMYFGLWVFSRKERDLAKDL